MSREKRNETYLDELTDEQKKELQKLAEEMSIDAKDVVKDYEKNPSELSGSAIQLHDTSPFLDETLEGHTWKRVLKGDPIEIMKSLKKKKDAD
jgi:TRAP-type C4-dicarboxylate transport system substrate-binding protein